MDLYNMTNIFPILLVILDNFQWKIWIANGPPGKGTGGHTDGQTNPVSRTGHALVRGQIGGKERSIMEHIYWKERKMSNKHRRSVCYGRDTHPGSNCDFGPLRTVFHGRTDGQTEGWTDKPYYRDARRSLRIIVATNKFVWGKILKNLCIEDKDPIQHELLFRKYFAYFIPYL